MSRVDSIFASLRADGHRGLMPFVCAGYPSPGGLGAQLDALQGGGASIVEVGIPFSDPIADGPVIAAAMHEALVAGMTPRAAFDEVRAARDSLDIALVAMVSVSLVHRDAGFVTRAADAGFDGLIVPDLPLEESDRLRGLAADAGLTCSLLVAPTTPRPRAGAIAQACTGFVYMLARTGITGERTDAPEIEGRVADLRRETDLPIACGFGISTPAHVRAVVRHADAAIVGSALIKRMSQAAQDGDDPASAAGTFTADLSTGLSIA